MYIKNQSRFNRDQRSKIKNFPEIIFGIIIIGYIILFSYLSIHRMYALNSYYYDLGIMNQTVYNTSRGWFLEMTNQEFIKNISRLAVHFDPILAVFAPFYWFFPRPEILLISQTIVLASGAWAIYLISKKFIRNRWLSLLFSTAYLSFFPVERANLFDFHAVVLATGFLLWAVYFSLIKKRLTALIFVLLALLTKEQAGLIILLFGFYLFIFKKEKRFGLLVSLLGGIFFLGTVFVIIPYFRQQSHFALKYFDDFGETPAQVILGVIKKPSITFKYLARPESVNYLKQLFLPYLPYIIFSPIQILISLPEVLINTLSTSSNMRNIYFHYNSLIVPFIFFSAIAGATKLKKSKLGVIILAIFIYLNLRSIYLYSPLPLAFLNKPYTINKLNTRKLEVIQKWQKILKNDQIKLSTTPKLAPFFTSRRYYYNFLYDPAYMTIKITETEIIERMSKYEQADYVIINKEEIGSLGKNSLPAIFYQHLLGNKSFEKIFTDQSGIEVFKKLNSS